MRSMGVGMRCTEHAVCATIHSGWGAVGICAVVIVDLILIFAEVDVLQRLHQFGMVVPLFPLGSA